MKNVLVIFVFALVLLTACGQEAGVGDSNDIAETEPTQGSQSATPEVAENILDEMIDANVSERVVYHEVEIYKGISVGKTIDEINRNPDLLNQLEASHSEIDDSFSSECYFIYKDVLVRMVLELDDDLRCTEIQITAFRDSLL